MRGYQGNAKWRYGDAGDQYPVMPNEVWKVGPHRFICADMEIDAVQRLNDMGVQPDVIYTDPPWGAALATGYRTKAGMKRKVDYNNEFLPALSQAYALSKGSVFIENGYKFEGSLVNVLWRNGGTRKDRWEITYNQKKPCLLFRFTWNNDDGFDLDLNGSHNERTPFQCLKWYNPGKLILDPCCGMGLTALACAQAGHFFVGVELHPRRMALGMRKLGLVINETPFRVG